MKKVGRLFREDLTNQIKENIQNNNNVFLFSYSQLSGIKLSDLRKNLSNAGAGMCVSKNTIAQLALKDLELEKLSQQIQRQTAFVWSNSDSVEISKILVEFAKGCDVVFIQGGILEGKILGKDDVKRLSDLPSREILLTMLLSAIQSPLTRFAQTLNAKTRDLLSILKQLSEKNGGN